MNSWRNIEQAKTWWPSHLLEKIRNACVSAAKQGTEQTGVRSRPSSLVFSRKHKGQEKEKEWEEVQVLLTLFAAAKFTPSSSFGASYKHHEDRVSEPQRCEEKKEEREGETDHGWCRSHCSTADDEEKQEEKSRNGSRSPHLRCTHRKPALQGTQAAQLLGGAWAKKSLSHCYHHHNHYRHHPSSPTHLHQCHHTF